jgi:hypothetical protein
MNSNIKFNGHKTITDFKNSGLKETINDIYDIQPIYKLLNYLIINIFITIFF